MGCSYQNTITSQSTSLHQSRDFIWNPLSLIWIISITNLFLLFNEEFKPGNHLIDLFSDRFSFYPYSSNIKKHMEKLDNITFRVLLNTYSSIVVSNTSIKNHIVTFILYIHLYNKPIIKTIHRVVNVTTTEAELFTIQCGINQVVSITNVNYIVIITDSLYTAKRIFDSSSHPH